MFDKIQKRDGNIEDFTIDKIKKAISKASMATQEFGIDEVNNLTIKTIENAKKDLNGSIPTVEDIQNQVEKTLMDSSYYKTARAYILYRDQREKIRSLSNLASVEMIDQYIEKLDWQVKENSNMTYSLQGLNNYISSEISKVYWLNKIYPKEIREAHLSGDIHLHDLNILSTYCVGWDLRDLLTEGFKGAKGKLESKPTKHFRSALGQVVNFLFTLQGEAAGAQAFSNFDTFLAPFIHFDNLTYKEVKQALQEFVFNLNVPTRIGFQTPFTNITLDLQMPKYLEDQPVVIGGTLQEATYKQFQKEMDIFNKAFFEVLLEGDAKERIFTFPIPTINITKDFDWDNENLDGLWKLTAKYGIPYFSNFINSDMNPEDARSMCCRLRIDNRAIEKKGGLFGSNPLTGSMGVVTINLPRIGYLANSEEEFLNILGKQMDKAKESLEIKRKVLEHYTENNLYPYTKFYLRDIKNRYGCYWKNHFSTIGVVGMNEACLNLFKENIAAENSKEFTLKVLDFMLDRLNKYKEETGNNYNLEATPAEGVSYRLAKLDQDKFPAMLTCGISMSTEPFYTNSTNLPVNFSDDVFEVLDIQNDLQKKYSGGTVLHMFVGEKIDDYNVVKHLVKKVCNNYEIPYFTITPSFSICCNHGYLSGEVEICPDCGEECEIYSRVVGYLRPTRQWNKGKQAEFALRKTFKVK